MSLLMTEPKEQTFLDRFARLREALRRYQVLQGLCWVVLAGSLGLLALVAADYLLELSRDARAAGLACVATLTLLVFATLVLIPWGWWTKPRTAVEIERRFPSLGQRIRTVVQYAGVSPDYVRGEGVTPSLVDALEAETELRIEPVPLASIVPYKRLVAAAVLASFPPLLLMFAAATGAEWQLALRRALLLPGVYSTLTVKPGNLIVDEGQSVPIAIEVAGRPQRDVVLLTRSDNQPKAPWTSAPLKGGPGPKRKGRLEKLKHALAYRVVAGSVSSPTYVARVRYPLAIRSFEVGLVAPSYTKIKPATVKGGNLRALAGTVATFRIAFDTPPAEATLVLDDVSTPLKKNETPPPPRVIQLNDGGSALIAELTLASSGIYRIEARTADGRRLPKNRYRIDVRDDHPPRVSFQEPDEALEVHSIAEIRNRVRVTDDFGLTRAGIVFRFNDGEDQSLIARDFTAAAASEKPATSAALEEMLLLETLAASPTDSVTYFAFAEDNDPAGSKRTETDLRYIDIRPFKRLYKKGENGEEAGGQSTSLGELIARQRFNLNRGARLGRQKPTDKGPGENPFKIAGFEETLVGLTREFTEGLEGIVGERVEPLHLAEEAMLAAVEALDRGRNTEASRPMAEALRHLISARRTIETIIADGASAAAMRIRQFDRSQAQKIRKDKKGNEEAEEVADELEELAKEEDFVYATLAKDSDPADMPMPGQPGKVGESEPKETSKGEAEKPTEASGKSEGKEPGEESAKPKTEPRETATKQEKIVEAIRAIEERLKRLNEVSDLAKARMAKAAGEAETTSNALARGNTKEATGAAKGAAAMLHELARQVKGEIAREVADELAMARDLAQELAGREAELGAMPRPPVSGSKDAPSEDGEGQGKGKGKGPGEGGSGSGQGPAEAERLERLREAARTLEEWLKGVTLRAEGEAAANVRDVVEANPMAPIVERMDRIGELIAAGLRPEARDEANQASNLLEMLARKLDVLHRELIAPEVASLVKYDKRIDELMKQLGTLKGDAEITDWHVKAAELVRELEQAGLGDQAAELTKAMAAGGWRDDVGGWVWGTDPKGSRIVPVGYLTALRSLSVAIQEKVQDLILRDLASARDEAIPPEFKQLVERYYEVLSTGVAKP